jgi:uncharacterized protein (TIGR03437 family)
MHIRLSTLLLCSGVAFAASPSYPVLTYSTYLRDSFTPNAIATDSAGNVYMAGNAIVDPATSQTTVLVVKLNPQATQYLYVRYLGGSVKDQANAIAVDSSGNAYIAGSTESPDFPVTGSSNLPVPLAGASSQRSFVAKLDSNGDLVFSNLLGGIAVSMAQAVAVNSVGQILVSGYSTTSGFPSTGGAYSIANTAEHPYLLELDPTGTVTIFSATGIGGSAIALDSSGNIYVAGTTNLLDYPTTPGVYQPTFPAFNICTSPSCFSPNQGANQYVSKIDPSGSKLIYSTALSGSGQTTNAGLAVDAAGDAYVTGFAGPTYPFTVSTPPPIAGGVFVTFGSPFLSKLDPAGQTLLFSVPVGGAGVQVDSKGSVYVGGEVGASLPGNYAIPAAAVPSLANVPTPCLPNVTAQSQGTFQIIQQSAYAAQIDGASGNVLGTQFIGGSALTVSGVAFFGSTLTGSTLWIAGATSLPNFPFTPNALTPANLGPAPVPGAYLGAVNFSQPQPPAGTPQIGCIVDAADFAPAGPVVLEQILTLYGTGLGPATANSVPVGVSFGAGSPGSGAPVSAPLLYVSPTQINFAVPVVPYGQPSSVMQLTVNGVSSAPLELPLTYANPSLYLTTVSPQPIAVALNADGTVNSSANPAQLGSAVSVFVNGLTPDPQVNNAPLQLSSTDGWSITDVVQATPYVLRVDLEAPSKLVNNFACSQFGVQSVCSADFTLYDTYQVGVSPQAESAETLAFGAAVYVSDPQ